MAAILSCRRYAVAVLAFLSMGSAAAADEPLSIEDIARRAAEVERAAGDPAGDPPGTLTVDEWARIRAIAAGAQSVPAAPTDTAAPGGQDSGARESARFAILVSFAEPETVRAALIEVSGRPDATVVFRGLPRNSLQAFYGSVRPLMAGIDPVPAVTIDPPIFRRFDISVVPAVVDLASGEMVRGTVSLSALDRFGSTAPGELVGPVAAIAEEDLAAVLKARAAALDGPALTARAQEGFWSNQKAYPLPRALRDETRMVDPSVYAAADIVTPAGVVLARAGQRVNPLEIVPFGLTVIAFDATDPDQVAVAVREAAGAARPVLVITDFDRSGGWSAFGRLEDQFRAPVYLLDERLARRLSIQAVPSIVTGVGHQLQVRTAAVGGAPP